MNSRPYPLSLAVTRINPNMLTKPRIKHLHGSVASYKSDLYAIISIHKTFHYRQRGPHYSKIFIHVEWLPFFCVSTMASPGVFHLRGIVLVHSFIVHASQFCFAGTELFTRPRRFTHQHTYSILKLNGVKIDEFRHDLWHVLPNVACTGSLAPFVWNALYFTLYNKR